MSSEMTDTPLQREIRAMEMRLLEEMGEALTRCRSHGERDQCRTAYYAVMRHEQDTIGQKHGLRPAARRRSELS